MISIKNNPKHEVLRSLCSSLLSEAPQYYLGAMCMFLDRSGKHWNTVNIQTPNRKAWAKTESEPFCSGCILFIGSMTIKLSNQDAGHMVDALCWQQPESSVLIKSCNVSMGIKSGSDPFFNWNSYIVDERSNLKMNGDNVRWMLKLSLQPSACSFLAYLLMLVCVCVCGWEKEPVREVEGPVCASSWQLAVYCWAHCSVVWMMSTIVLMGGWHSIAQQDVQYATGCKRPGPVCLLWQGKARPLCFTFYNTHSSFLFSPDLPF